MLVVQVRDEGATRLGVAVDDEVHDISAVRPGLAGTADLLARFDEDDVPAALAEIVRETGEPRWRLDDLLRGTGGATLACPVEAPEVWGAGVTYELSREARVAESEGSSNIYLDVFRAERPELFLKAAGMRQVVDPGEAIGVRRESISTVPEPELAVVVGRNRRIVGYTLADDVTARDIEAQNPLYLPQAKIYDASCSFGPAIWFADNDDYRSWSIELEISADGVVAFHGSTSVDRLSRTIPDLVRQWTSDNSVACGSVLMTGTGIVPPPDFGLESGHTVTITVHPLGLSLMNSVIRWGGASDGR